MIIGMLQQQQVEDTFSDCTTLQERWYSRNKEREVLIVQDLARFAKQQNTSFVLVLLPVTSCNFTNLFQDFKDSINSSSTLDLQPYFANNTQQYYYPIDQHWNKEGHLLVSIALIPYVNQTEER